MSLAEPELKNPFPEGKDLVCGLASALARDQLLTRSVQDGRSVFHATQTECRIRADSLGSPSDASKKARLCGLPYLPALQRLAV